MKLRQIEVIHKNLPLKIEYFLRQGKKPAIFYLHGLGCSREDFSEAAKQSQLDDNTLFALDFPGFGGSSYPENAAYSMDDLMEIVADLTEQIKVERFFLVGHSMGGLVGLLFAEKYPERVLGFVNVEGNLASEDCFISREVTKHDFDYFCQKIFPEFKKKCARSQNKGLQRYAKQLETISERAYFNYCPSMTDYSDNGNLVERFLALRMPKLFVYGSENAKLSYIPRLKETGCAIVEIPNSNHWPAVDNPQAYYQALADFCRK